MTSHHNLEHEWRWRIQSRGMYRNYWSYEFVWIDYERQQRVYLYSVNLN